MSIRRTHRRLRAWFVLLGIALVLVSPASVRADDHGNVKSRVYHGERCRYYDCANCSAVFATPVEAKRAGYKPCGSCRPERNQSALAHEGSYSGNRSSRAGFAPAKCCRP